MFVVAITELRSPVEPEAAALAADLSVTAYDARALLLVGAPALVKATPDKGQALDLLGRLRARGHDAVACDTATVVAAAEMVSMRRLRLEDDAVALGDRPGERLPYAEVLALVAAVHRKHTSTTRQVRETRFSATRAVLTSGLSLTKTVEKETRETSDERDAVLYVFRTADRTPWLLREHGTTWSGHGAPVAPTESENFRITVAALRARAKAAVYDDRLVTRRAASERAFGGLGAPGSEGAVDLLAHLVALSIARAAGARQANEMPRGA